jgi:hypothetical protein
MANRDGTLCTFVRPEIVVEVKCSDLVESDANDVPIRRMTLRYDEKDGYVPAGDGAIASMLSPVFLRERTDKVPDAASVGIDQITSRLPIDESDAPIATTGAAAKILERRVFAKGTVAVRKVVVMDTNKPGSPLYPPFVVYTTDYSGGRAEPLKTSLRPCSTLESAQAFVAQWLTENVKRGWQEIGPGGAPVAAATTGDNAGEPKKKARSSRTKASDS